MCPCTELSSWEHSSSPPHDGAVTCVWKGALITSKLVFGRQYNYSSFTKIQVEQS